MPPVGHAPAHRFIAAMAGLVNSGGPVIHTTHAVAAHTLMLVAPRAMIA